MSVVSQLTRAQPIIKWAGGKEKELKFIVPNLPHNYTNYFDPFVGGGSVFTSLNPSGRIYLNDKSQGLINLYQALQTDSFFDCFAELLRVWDFIAHYVEFKADTFIDIYRKYTVGTYSAEEMQSVSFALLAKDGAQLLNKFSLFLVPVGKCMLQEMQKGLFQKIRRMKVIEQKMHTLEAADVLMNIESGLKSGVYTACRRVYNDIYMGELSSSEQGVLFFFVHSMAYSGMFRYNRDGQFNVPYGGIGYNRKSFIKKIAFLQSEFLQQRLENAVIENLDFEAFLHRHQPQKEDFIFVDPPYDSDFSTYLQNIFTQQDHQRLAEYLHNCKARWMLIIKNTPFIDELYAGKGLNIQIFDKKYLVSFMNRNDKHAEHLLIRNYNEQSHM